jgi:hypothetical protein
MPNLKDTDIDDLFQRASDKYPLRTDGADWDRMAAALEKQPPAPPDAVGAEEKRKKRRFFWLFLLLPLAGAGYYAWHHGGATGVRANTAVVPTIPGGKTNAATAGAPATAQNATAQTPATTPAAATTGTQDPLASSNAWATPTKNHSSHHNVHNSAATEEETQPDNSLSLTAANTRQQPGGEKFGGEAQNVSEDRLFYDLQRAPIPHDYRLAVNVTAPAAKDTTAKAKAKTQPTTKHFYAGVFGSPDLSTVKMQSVKGVGSTFGILFGYTFNGGHWAIETGASVDRKKYYTDGEYFSTKEVHLPANAWLTDVDGVCYMWEIPLNVRYNFNPGAKTSWFATAGFSTYLMSHEKYAYGLEWSGSSGVYDSTWNIHKPSQYPFSIINLSAGFEQRLGKIGNLRVEPYVRLPLTGLGMGKLPIMSAGVNIGITRQLW